MIKVSCQNLVPERATPGSSGFDLSADLVSPLTIRPGQICIVPTGVRIAVPYGFEGQVRSRSGLASQGIVVVNSPGTIDSDYRGAISVILANISEEKRVISPDQRIAQLVICPVYMGPLEVVTDLPDTVRGTGGFGSTGE